MLINGLDSQLFAARRGVMFDTAAVNRNASRIGSQRARENPDQRRFAGTVLSD
jgi:hypothetical protein